MRPEGLFVWVTCSCEMSVDQVVGNFGYQNMSGLNFGSCFETTVSYFLVQNAVRYFRNLFLVNREPAATFLALDHRPRG